MRRAILLLLALVVAFGCVVPSVFHDIERRGAYVYRHNRLTGDTLVECEWLPQSFDCLTPPRRSVFGR